MSVLQRSDLEASPLADLHALASTLNIDGFRRLRREELIDAILTRQEAAPADAQAAPEDPGEESPKPAATRRRRGRWPLARADHDEEAEREQPAELELSDGSEEQVERIEDEAAGVQAETEEGFGDTDSETASETDSEADVEVGAPGARSGRRGARGTRETEQVVEGVIELQPNGSGFVRLVEGETSDGDVYVSAAQVRRCELVPGDRVSGPVRPARRSERYASLIRVATINGESADEVAVGTRFDDLEASFPSEQLQLGAEEETLAAVDRLAPVGRGSRVVIAGPSRAGKTELLRRIASVLADRGGLTLEVTLVGVRPEEVAEWQQPALAASPPLSFAASAEAQAQVVEQAVERGRRIAARGADAVVLIDTLDGLHPPAARRALAAARNLTERGSLTIIATAAKPFGGETTVIALDLTRASTGQVPALDPLASGTVRPDLLVGADGAAAIIAARAEALAEG